VSRYNEILAFVERGLEDVSITRASFDWGIPFPIPDQRGRHQTIYVWFDALPNYLTATGYPDSGGEIAWPAQVHVVGKDITRFHCVLWPAVLHAAGLPLPGQVWVHGFVTANGTRLSKTAGVWIELDTAIARHGPTRSGTSCCVRFHSTAMATSAGTASTPDTTRISPTRSAT
jgi:methionyl-tRNA synthetase